MILRRRQRGYWTPFLCAPRAALDSSSGDPHFASVVLLAINDNAADGSTTFVDQSSSAKTLTANGNAQYDTGEAPTGMTSSGLFDGNGDSVSAADSADWVFGTGDFTIEFMLRLAAVGTQQFFISQDNGSTRRAWGIWRNLSTLTFYYSTNGSTITQLPSAAWAASLDTWYHIAACRDGANMRLFIDGTQHSTTHNISTSSIADVAEPMRIGHWGSTATLGTNGSISNVRITKGVARYTGAFTPPTLPLPTS